jgi:FolB domain-containing protein
MNDRIHLFEVALECRIGVSAEERRLPQPLLADVTVETDIRAAAASGDVAATIDYSQILDLLQALAGEKEYVLIETLVEAMAARILERFPVMSVRILLKKPAALRHRGVGAAAVEIVRQRHD